MSFFLLIKILFSYLYLFFIFFFSYYFSGPLSEVQTAVGLEVFLPCDLMPGTAIASDADKVQLVIWYKEGNVKPIYT